MIKPISSNGSCERGEGNVVAETRHLFVYQTLLAVVVDMPQDRRVSPHLGGFRQRREHTADVKAGIAWVRQEAQVPVWLVGTSRGTSSAAYVATELVGPEGPDGLVLTSTMLTNDKGRPVPAMPLGKLRIPVLVLHREQDGRSYCSFKDIPGLMHKLGKAPRKALLSFKGGADSGNPCGPFACQGFNGLEREVVAGIANWIVAR